MAVSGFEGFEKRLELRFSGDDPLGLRRLAVDALQEVLEAVQCSIVSAAGNRSFDAYILSESSLFLYPHKVIIKTCGTTQLLRSIPCLLRHTAGLGLTLLACRYSRGSFIFPSAQPAPHTSFADEVLYLDDRLPPSLTRRRKACVLPCAAAAAAESTTHSSWHVYSAAAAEGSSLEGGDAALEFGEFFTVEVCMTELDRTLAERFFRREGDDRSGDAAGAEMTASTGIGGINPGALVCGFAFEPCGYSMNGLDRDRYSTIHVTPEDGHSYASYEGVGRWGPGPRGAREVVEPLRRVIRVFAPGAVSVSVCMRKQQLLLQGAPPAGEGDQDQEPEEEEEEDRGVCSAIEAALEPLGLTCRSRAAENFPGAGAVTYQTFTARRK